MGADSVPNLSDTPSDVPDVLCPGMLVVLRSIPLVLSGVARA
jgi:hypothetical protein